MLHLTSDNNYEQEKNHAIILLLYLFRILVLVITLYNNGTVTGLFMPLYFIMLIIANHKVKAIRIGQDNNLRTRLIFTDIYLLIISIGVIVTVVKNSLNWAIMLIPLILTAMYILERKKGRTYSLPIPYAQSKWLWEILAIIEMQLMLFIGLWVCHII